MIHAGFLLIVALIKGCSNGLKFEKKCAVKKWLPGVPDTGNFWHLSIQCTGDSWLPIPVQGNSQLPGILEEGKLQLPDIWDTGDSQLPSVHDAGELF